MNKIVSVCVLLVVTLAMTSAWSFRSVEENVEKQVYKKELTRKYVAHSKRLWQLVKRAGIEDDFNCEVVASCYTKFGTDIDNVYKRKGTEAQCSSICDAMGKCVEGKLRDGSLCKSCNTDAQVNMVTGIQGMDSFKGVVCAGLMKADQLKDCNDKILDCAEVCLEEKPDISPCEKCLKSLAPTMASTNKCPMLPLLKELKLTYDLIGSLYEAYGNGCPEKDMASCDPVYTSVDCTSTTALEKALKKSTTCMKNLANKNRKCTALAEIADMLAEKKELMINQAQKSCKAEKMVGTSCTNKSNRLRELLRRFLQEHSK